MYSLAEHWVDSLLIVQRSTCWVLEQSMWLNKMCYIAPFSNLRLSLSKLAILPYKSYLLNRWSTTYSKFPRKVHYQPCCNLAVPRDTLRLFWWVWWGSVWTRTMKASHKFTVRHRLSKRLTECRVAPWVIFEQSHEPHKDGCFPFRSVSFVGYVVNLYEKLFNDGKLWKSRLPH